MKVCIDTPTPDSLCDGLNLRVEGWLFLDGQQDQILQVEARLAGAVAGSTGILYDRPDVRRALGLTSEIRTGFSILGHLTHEPERKAPRETLELWLMLRDGTTIPAASTSVKILERDYRDSPFGDLLDPQESKTLRHRDYIYSTGHPSTVGSDACLLMLRRYLPPPPCHVVDVGCGLGWYGRELLRDGYDWMGTEMRESDCQAMARQDLPHRQIDGRNLPFSDDSFDVAMCIEVLEHVAERDDFLGEIRRIAPRLLVSVPNVELLPYLHPYLAAPWHMLEGDHKNFFTRWSLKSLLGRFYDHVEVLSYGEAPLKTVEGLPLNYHLFAIASSNP